MTTASLITEIDAAASTALERLRDASRIASGLTATADDVLDHFVSQARAAGHSWAEIGTEVGVSKQAAQQRFVGDSSLPPSMSIPAAKRPGSKRFECTRRLRRVLRNATREARRRGHTYVGTEHVLLAMTEEPHCTALLVLEHLGVPAQDLVTALENHAQAPGRRSRGRFTRPARDLMETMVMEAIGLGHNYVDTEHLLLAATRSPGSAGVALAEVDISYENARAAIVHILATQRSA